MRRPYADRPDWYGRLDFPLDTVRAMLRDALRPAASGATITRESAISMLTRGSAYAEFAEHERGTLAPGMLADLAVLSQDVVTVPAPALRGTTSVLTVVAGRIVHDDGSPSRPEAQRACERPRRRSCRS